MNINKFTTIVLGAVLVLGATISVQADDKKMDPSGTYVWVMPGRNGGSDRTNSLTLKLEGEALTGKLTSPGRDGKTNEVAINNVKLTGTNVSFSVVRTYNDNTFTNKYTGVISDSAIKGKIEFVRDGETQSRGWEAKLQK
ncbi:MAG: hypothetical protein WDN00_03080 [Limisphaerales bacterium]